MREHRTSPSPPHDARATRAGYRWLVALLPWIALVHAGALLVTIAWLDERHPAADVAAFALLVLGVGSALFTMWRTELASRYVPVAPPEDDLLPTITVVVPAFNEGAPVLDTLRSIVAGDYPRDRLQIVAVDDGSDDDTYAWMLLAEAELGEVVELVRLPRNRGKREALAAGFVRATGAVVVTIDSDSIVRPDALRHLVAPLVCRPGVGAVAGNVRVVAQQASPWSRILDNAFTYSFEVVRAAQSALGAVLCTPGAAAAYRRDLVLDALPAWRDEMFLGRPASIGEDRALTNRILAAGFQVTFQSTAVIDTLVPDTFSALRRMLLRWARSNVRESLVLLSFVFTPFRSGSLWGVRVMAVQEAAALLLAALGLGGSLVALATRPLEVLAAVVLGAIGAATIPAMAYALLRRRSPAWAFAHALASTFLLSWITPWALLTPHHASWLTRASAPPPPRDTLASIESA